MIDSRKPNIDRRLSLSRAPPNRSIQRYNEKDHVQPLVADSQSVRAKDGVMWLGLR